MSAEALAPLITGQDWWSVQRAAARARFLALGTPNKRQEYWRYTDPRVLTTPVTVVGAANASLSDGFAQLEQPRAVLVGGVLRPDLSTLPPWVQPLVADHPLADHLGRLEALAHRRIARPLAALAGALAEGGLVIDVPAGQHRLGLRFIGHAAMGQRILLRLAAGAVLTLTEETSGPARNHAVIEAELAEGAVLRHIRLQDGRGAQGDYTAVFAALQAGARLVSFTLSGDGALQRNETVVWLDGSGATAHISGAIMARGQTHTDNTVFITHAAPGCESRQVFKHVLDGQATAVFQGKILVDSVAQKTDGYQISQSILLSDRAQFNAKPELEIYADDVKCSHGSTSGAVDEQSLFYLMARGIPKAAAISMLVAAFLDEAVAEIGDEAVEAIIRARIANWMDVHGK